MPASVSRFSAQKATFGRTQTFTLKLGWLPKISKAVMNNPRILASDDAIGELGVGKNMVTAMRLWSDATCLLNFDDKQATLTPFGEFLFGADGVDPYMEDDATLWLLHWKICSRPHVFTAGYWMFNEFHQSSFLEKKAVELLSEKMKNEKNNGHEESIKRDVKTILSMYARRHKQIDEDNLSSPFPSLDLISYNEEDKEYHSTLEDRESLPSNVIGYAAAELMMATEKNVISLRTANKTEDYPDLSSSFRLTEDGLLEKLNDICRFQTAFKIQNVTGDWQLMFIGDVINPEIFLKGLYDYTH